MMSSLSDTGSGGCEDWIAVQGERGKRGMSNQEQRVRGISIVCVFNDLEMRQDCLDRSIAAYTGDVDVDYIPVDNRRHEFTSAGAALNHGAARARHDVVVFVHQDVYLHSIDRIAHVGAQLNGDTWGILGASGAPSQGQFIGRMRDRVQVIGRNADLPLEVESLDEVMFMIRRDRVLDAPLTTDPDLAWHAYAVEYGLRMRRRGLGVGAVNLAITHNSLTVNLARLAAGHDRVGALYPDLLPVRTTCGLIGSRTWSWRDAPVIRSHGWRLGWLARSLRSIRPGQALGVPVVFGDIRTDVDLLGFNAKAPLKVVNLDAQGGFARYAHDTIRLDRSGSPVDFRAVASVDQLLDEVAALPAAGSVLLADLAMKDLSRFVDRLPNQSEWLLGLQQGAIWMLGGPVVRELPSEWTARQAVPLSSRLFRPRRLIRKCRSPRGLIIRRRVRVMAG